MADPFDVAACTALAARAASGDEDALNALLGELWPAWLVLVRTSRSMGSFATSEDRVRDVATGLVEKLKRRGGHTLRLYLLWQERHPEKTLLDWIRIITKNAIRNYVIQELGPRRPDDDGPSPKRLLNEAISLGFLKEVGATPGLTAAQTARELLEFAEMHLAVPQQRVLGLWLEGASFDDIAGQLGITSGEANRLQRAAVAVLRRQFAPADARPAP